MIEVIFWEEGENSVQQGALPAVPRVGEIVQLRSGITYEVVSVGWDLNNRSKAERPTVYINIKQTTKGI